MVQLVQQNPDIAPYINTKYACEGASPSRAKLNALIPEVLSLIPCSRVVIDGLDECLQQDQVQILRDIVRLFSGVGIRCKVLFSCREIPAITKALRRKPVLSLSDRGKFVERDIQRFIRHNLLELEGEGSWDSLTIDSIGKKIVTKAKGKHSFHEK